MEKVIVQRLLAGLPDETIDQFLGLDGELKASRDWLVPRWVAALNLGAWAPAMEIYQNPMPGEKEIAELTPELKALMHCLKQMRFEWDQIENVGDRFEFAYGALLSIARFVFKLDNSLTYGFRDDHIVGHPVTNTDLAGCFITVWD